MSKSGKKLGFLKYIVAILLLIVAFNSMVVCHEDEYKLIRQFGKVQRVITESGLNVKVPFVQSVDTIPKQILTYDLPASDVITSDKKSMIVDSYVLWQVSDPLKFTQTLAGSVYNAESRINALVYNATKNTVSSMTQDEVIKSRDGKMTVTAGETEEEIESNDLILEEVTEVEIKSLTEEIMEQIGTDYEQYGIRILAVEVKKLDLPDDNKQAVYTRMISERENIAAQYTAEGESQAQMIQNTTDKEVSIMLSEANAQAEQLIAEGEAEYMRILSDAYADESRSEFYSFVRSLDAAKESLKGSNDKTLILPEDSPIAQIFSGQ